VSLMDTIDQVSAGVDEFRITAHPRRCGDAKRKNDKKEGKKAAKAKIAKNKKEKKAKSSKDKSKKDKSKKDKSKKEITRTRARTNKKNKKRGLEGEDLDFEGADEEFDPKLIEDANADGPSTPVECRVAFAYHSSKISESFKNILGLREKFMYNDDDISFGWSNGPLASSNYGYSMDMFVEGLPGVAVGKVSVEYDGSEATVSVEAGERLWLKEINAYVGHSRLPMTDAGELTIDPADYPVAYERLSLSRTFTVEELNDEPLYVIAQTTVCGVFPKEESEGSEDGGAKKWSLGGVLKNLV